MEKKYSKSLVEQYINGNDIEGYEMEELENNIEFMKEVISISDDKNMYELCSDELKHDKDFVLFLIEKYSDDLKFVRKVFEEYMHGASNLSMEVLLASDILDDDQYKMLLNTVYNYKRTYFYMIKQQAEKKIANEMGYGFWFILDEYHGNSKLVNYFVQRLVNEIFEDNGIDLEGLLHKSFSSLEELEKTGINCFLVNFIEQFDNTLSSYLSTHIELLYMYSSKYNKIKNRWDKFNKDLEKRKYNRVVIFIDNYLKENENIITLDELQVVYYLGKKLNILDKLIEYGDYKVDVDDINDDDYFVYQGKRIYNEQYDSYLYDEEDIAQEDEKIFDDIDESYTENELGIYYDENEIDRLLKDNIANKRVLDVLEEEILKIINCEKPTQEELDIEKNGGKVTKFVLKKKDNK